MHWGDAEMRELVEVLPLCAEATELSIAGSFHEVTAKGVGVLTRFVDEGKLPAKLKEINWYDGPSLESKCCTARKTKKLREAFAQLRAAGERRGIATYGF